MRIARFRRLLELTRDENALQTIAQLLHEEESKLVEDEAVKSARQAD